MNKVGERLRRAWEPAHRPVRVLAAADHHLRAPVHPRGEDQGGVERLGGQRPQQLAFEGPVMPNVHRPVADAPPVIGYQLIRKVLPQATFVLAQDSIDRGTAS